MYRKNLSDYAKSKVKAELLIREKHSNLIIRLPSLFGVNQRQKSKLIPKLFEKYIKNINFEIKNDELREYMYVVDASNFIVNNINSDGTLDMNGNWIYNSRMEKMIYSICTNKFFKPSNKHEKSIYNRLKLVYKKISTTHP